MELTDKKEINVELTKEQIQNLLVFLSRVDLKGNEVPAYVEILNLFNVE